MIWNKTFQAFGQSYKGRDDVRDFIIKNETTRGFDNFINLLGIESPGLTASLSIGEYVKQLIRMKI